MKGKIVCITGGSGGIGMATARSLAEMGATVILAGRDETRGQEVARQLQKAIGSGEVYALPLDLASFASILHFAEAFQSRFPRLDVLINNAAVLTSWFQTTPEGFEQQIGVNYIGHFLLTRELLPLLKKAPAPRLINVSSGAHYSGKIDFDSFTRDVGNYQTMVAYGQSKLANVLFTREHARRYPEIEAYCLHPGMVRTRIGNKRTNWLVSTVWSLLRPFIRSLDQGAQTSIYLASAENIPAENGQYFDQNRQARRPSELALDDALAQELWERTEQLIDRRKMRDER